MQFRGFSSEAAFPMKIISKHAYVQKWGSYNGRLIDRQTDRAVNACSGYHQQDCWLAEPRRKTFSVSMVFTLCFILPLRLKWPIPIGLLQGLKNLAFCWPLVRAHLLVVWMMDQIVLGCYVFLFLLYMFVFCVFILFYYKSCVKVRQMAI